MRLTEFRHVPARALPYGAQRGLKLAVALATRCRLLLLDEPAAGLNPEETDRVRAVIQGLRASGLTIATNARVIEAYLGAESAHA